MCFTFFLLFFFFFLTKIILFLISFFYVLIPLLILLFPYPITSPNPLLLVLFIFLSFPFLIKKTFSYTIFQSTFSSISSSRNTSTYQSPPPPQIHLYIRIILFCVFFFPISSSSPPFLPLTTSFLPFTTFHTTPLPRLLNTRSPHHPPSLPLITTINIHSLSSHPAVISYPFPLISPSFIPLPF